MDKAIANLTNALITVNHRYANYGNDDNARVSEGTMKISLAPGINFIKDEDWQKLKSNPNPKEQSYLDDLIAAGKVSIADNDRERDQLIKVMEEKEVESLKEKAKRGRPSKNNSDDGFDSDLPEIKVD